ncbi:hypothetical protein ACXHJ2_16610 [Paenibacillus sp. ALE3]
MSKIDFELVSLKLKEANISGLTYDQDNNDIYQLDSDWIVCELSAAADGVVGEVLAGAPAWAELLLEQNKILRDQLAERERTIARLTKELEEARRNLNIQQAKIKMLEVDNEMLESMVGQG